MDSLLNIDCPTEIKILAYVVHVAIFVKDECRAALESVRGIGSICSHQKKGSFRVVYISSFNVIRCRLSDKVCWCRKKSDPQEVKQKQTSSMVVSAEKMKTATKIFSRSSAMKYAKKTTTVPAKVITVVKANKKPSTLRASSSVVSAKAESPSKVKKSAKNDSTKESNATNTKTATSAEIEDWFFLLLHVVISQKKKPDTWSPLSNRQTEIRTISLFHGIGHKYFEMFKNI